MSERDHPLRVIKLGGSLLGWPSLTSELRSWLAAQPPAANVMIVGGGSLADAIRNLDAEHAIGEEPAHWLCIQAMSITAKIVAGLLPESQLVERLPVSKETAVGELYVLNAEPFLRELEPSLPGATLEHGWHVTSDSIAARVAILLAAEELVLLKSALPAENATPADGAELGFVDRFFPRLVAELSGLRCVNLRDDGHAEMVWK